MTLSHHPSPLTTIRLGLRLMLTGGARRRWSMALTCTGIAILVVGALVCAGTTSIVHGRIERTLARGLTIATDSTEPQGWATIRRIPYGDQMLLRVDIDPHDLTTTVPGVARWPAPGEMLVSPGAHTLLRHDPEFRRANPGSVTGTIGDDGLRTPGELVVYRGVPHSDQPRGGTGIVDRGLPGPTTRDTMDISDAQVAGLIALLAVVVGLPAVAFLSIAARLSAATRARRLGALHLIGAPPRFLRRVNAVEITVLAIVGWGAGIGVYPMVNGLLARSNLLGRTWFAGDTALSPTGAGVLLVLTVSFAAVVSRRTDIGDHMARVSVRSADAPRRTSALRLIPLTIGLVSLAVQVAVGSQRPDGATPYIRLDTVMLGAVVTSAVGVIVAMPVMVRSAGRWACRTAPWLSARLGGARAAFDPASTGRMVTALALTILASGVMIGQTRDARAVSTPVTAVIPVTLDASEVPEGLADTLSPSTGAPVLAVATSPPDAPDHLTVIVASCRTIAAALTGDAAAQSLDGCTDETTFLSGAASPRVDEVLSLVPEAPAEAVESPLVTFVGDTLVEGGADAIVTKSPADLIDEVRFGPETLPDGTVTYTTTVGIIVMATPETVTHVIAGILEVAPYAQPQALGLDPDSGEHIAMINGFLHLALALAGLITVIALATALTDRATQRARADIEVYCSGADPRLLRATHRWEVGITVGSGVLVALVCGTLGGVAWQYAGGLVRQPDILGIATLAAISVLLCLFTVATVGWAVPRRPDPSELRAE